MRLNPIGKNVPRFGACMNTPAKVQAQISYTISHRSTVGSLNARQSHKAFGIACSPIIDPTRVGGMGRERALSTPYQAQSLSRAIVAPLPRRVSSSNICRAQYRV